MAFWRISFIPACCGCFPLDQFICIKRENKSREQKSIIEYSGINSFLNEVRMKIKMIFPALTEAKSPYWRPIKYSLFPPLGLATLAAYCPPGDDIDLQDEHVEEININDNPELVIIQVYITNAYRAYALADHYRKKGAYVCLGGLHVSSLPEEAMPHADSIFIGPGEDVFPNSSRLQEKKSKENIYQLKTRN